MDITNTSIIELGVSYLLAAIVPGPSMTLIVKNSIVYSRLHGNLSALATVIGTAIQSGIVLIGIKLIDKNLYLVVSLKILCSFYLIYLGIKTILLNNELKSSYYDKQKTKSLNKFQSFIDALMIEILNPVALSFFFTIIVINYSSYQSYLISILYWFEIIALASIWFFFIAFLASSKYIKTYIKHSKKFIDFSSSYFFIIFGIYQLVKVFMLL